MSAAELRLSLPLNVSAEEARTVVAVKLYELGRVSLGQAAQLAGYGVPAFMDVLAHYGAAVVNRDASELTRELARVFEPEARKVESDHEGSSVPAR